MATTSGNSLIPPATALMPIVQSFYLSQKQVLSSMERMIEALKEAEKGHTGALQSFISASNSSSTDIQTRVLSSDTIWNVKCLLDERIRERKQKLEGTEHTIRAAVVTYYQ